EVPEPFAVGPGANHLHERKEPGVAFELFGIAEVVVFTLDLEEGEASLMSKQPRTDARVSPTAPDRLDHREVRPGHVPRAALAATCFAVDSVKAALRARTFLSSDPVQVGLQRRSDRTDLERRVERNA